MRCSGYQKGFHVYLIGTKKYNVVSGKFVDVDGEYDVNARKFVVKGDTDFKSEPFILSNPKDIEKSLPYENEIIGIK